MQNFKVIIDRDRPFLNISADEVCFGETGILFLNKPSIFSDTKNTVAFFSYSELIGFYDVSSITNAPTIPTPET